MYNLYFLIKYEQWPITREKEDVLDRENPEMFLELSGAPFSPSCCTPVFVSPVYPPDTGNRVVGEDSLGERSSSRGVMNLSPGFSEYRSTIVTGARDLCILKMDCIAGSTLLDDWLENWAYKC